MAEKRSDKWRIDQYNRNRAIEDQISTIEELEEAIGKLKCEPKIYERNPETQEVYERVRGDYITPRKKVITNKQRIAQFNGDPIIREEKGFSKESIIQWFKRSKEDNIGT